MEDLKSWHRRQSIDLEPIAQEANTIIDSRTEQYERIVKSLQHRRKV